MKPGSEFRALWRVDQDFVQLSAGRPVRAQRLDVPVDVAAHDHAYHEVCLVLSGGAVHVTKSGEAPLSRGDVFVVPPGEVHAIEDPRDLVVINAYYLAEWLMSDLGLLWTEPGAVPLFLSTSLIRAHIVSIVQLRLDEPAFARTRSELLEIEAEGAAAAPSPLLLRCCLQKAVSTISRAWIADDPSSATLAFRPEVWAGMEAIERSVNLGLPFSVADCAGSTRLSVDHFSALFRASTGHGPTEYFQRRRVHRSCQLLLNPRPSVTEVAADLGFSDAPHFCRVFKRYKGMTPSDYRKIYSA
jgi:AraC-like DNA-binding protein/mannose-6-phosphate isomerase-like protein (cupin superfamily)